MPQANAPIETALAACKAAFRRDGIPSLARRKDRIRALAAVTIRNRQAIRDALRADYVRHPDTLSDFVEVAAVPARCALAIEQLEAWAAREPRPLDAAMFGTATAHMVWQPKGVIGNIVPWNFPFELGLSPLAEMLAAGNRAIIKPSELAPACADLLARMIAETFDADEVTTILGGADVAEAFAAAPFDHLLFTGSTANGRKVMALAAPNLTPLTLELGGKCPAIIASGGLGPRTLQSILGLKLAKSGQICVTVDHIMVRRDQLEALVTMIEAYCATNLQGFSRGPSATGIISERHFDRVAGLIDDARSLGARIVDLETGAADDLATRTMPLRLVIDPPAAARVHREEIFGPILPIIPYDDIETAVAAVNAGESPLGIYIYGNDEAEIDAIIQNTRSGGITVNGAALHSASPNMAFGGVGASGYGRHHGVDGFRSYSYHRAILVRAAEDATDIIFPPYTAEKIAAADAAFDGLQVSLV